MTQLIVVSLAMELYQLTHVTVIAELGNLSGVSVPMGLEANVFQKLKPGWRGSGWLIVWICCAKHDIDMATAKSWCTR